MSSNVDQAEIYCTDHRDNSVPLTRAVRWLLVIIVHRGGVSCTVQLNDAVLKAVFTAAFAESSVTVNVEIKDGGRRTFSITRVHSHLKRVNKRDDITNEQY